MKFQTTHVRHFCEQLVGVSTPPPIKPEKLFTPVIILADQILSKNSDVPYWIFLDQISLLNRFNYLHQCLLVLLHLTILILTLQLLSYSFPFTQTNMSAATTFSYMPNLKFSPSLASRLKSPNPIIFRTSQNSISVCFASQWSGSSRHTLLEQKPMTELSQVFAFRSGTSGEDSAFVDTDAVMDNGLPEFQQDFAPGGLEYVVNKSSKWLVAVIFGVILIWKHDAEVLWTAMGSVLNAGLSITLKRILNQQRPVPGLKSDPGMPSSHAQSIFFCVVFIALALFEWLGINALTLTVGALVLSSGAYLSWLRVSQQLHSMSQVVVGAIIGTIFSAGWFYLWHGFVLEAFLSFLWVRLVVVSIAVGSCAVFVIYVIKNWLLDEI